MTQSWNEFDVLRIWEQQHGELHKKWKMAFISHPAMSQLLTHDIRDITWAINYQLLKNLDDILDEVHDLSDYQARDAWLEKREEELKRSVSLNNLDSSDAQSETQFWDENDSPPFDSSL